MGALANRTPYDSIADVFTCCLVKYMTPTGFKVENIEFNLFNNCYADHELQN